ncbi:MAG: putative hydroxymethylpyrimidine transporter CytX [Chloroflexi bacterium]|nr:putative hydroxymethylpyrimidine transporter CytX [Chloroflexota bacterium]MBI3733449.1 putative hydroxymethylpyrimidine transporter CytX [Chloroflexota bacterium]
MTAVSQHRKRTSFKIHAPPEWGIEPVPLAERKLGFVDFAVLWGDLGIGLLVLLAGSFLVPGLGLAQALLAIVIGSAMGSALLAIAGIVGSALGAPTMVLLRPALGIRGSYLPTALNILQLIGWTIFEIIIMASAANAISQALFGLNSYALWAVVSAAIVMLMGIGGPLVVIRQWLSKVAVWVMLATTLWLTYRLLSTNDVAALWSKAGDGSLPFWVAVDIVISLPVSWMPLVADYNRFAHEPRGAAWGTFVGYFITNVWFFALGALILLTSQLNQEPKEFATAIALTAGALALVILLVDETDNAWADLYSAAVSTQNIFPKLRQSVLIALMGVLSLISALVLDVTQYENFLLLLGSFFVPLFGVLLADYFVVRRRNYTTDELYRATSSIQWPAVAAWLVGVSVFQLTNPTFLGAYWADWTSIAPTALGAIGGSIPSFIAAFVLHVVLARVARARR